MKICDNCGRVVINKIEVCPKCDGKKFTELLVASYDDLEPWLEENNGP